jgi:hypothetical protein
MSFAIAPADKATSHSAASNRSAEVERVIAKELGANVHNKNATKLPQAYSVIVWGVSFSSGSAEHGIYCVMRYGKANSPWDEKLRGTGRISETAAPKLVKSGQHGSSNKVVTWNLSTIVLGSNETELSMHIHQSNGAPFDGVSVQLGNVSLAKMQKLPLKYGGHVLLTVALGGSAPSFRLREYGLSPSLRFEEANPIAQQQAVRTEDISGMGPMIVGTAPLPRNLQGLWWLSGQKSSSALVTFGGPNDDGNGCSVGYLTGDKNAYKIRVEGERVFSTAEPSAIDKLIEGNDQSYNFEFNDPVNPTMAQIYVFADGLGVKIQGEFSRNIMNFQMYLLPEEDPRRKQYPGSFVWLRNTTFFGINAGHDYLLVQVMDGLGSRIEPAWSSFAAYENSSTTGNYPGWIFYKSNFPSPSPGAPEIVAKIRTEVYRGMALIVVGASLLLFLCIVGIIFCCCCRTRTTETVETALETSKEVDT